MSDKTKNFLLLVSVAVIAYMLFADHKEAKELAAPSLGGLDIPGQSRIDLTGGLEYSRNNVNPGTLRNGAVSSVFQGMIL